MRITIALLFVLLACNNGTGTTGDAAPSADTASDTPADAIADALTLDAGADAGPFSCGAGLTCAANQYCEPQCCSGCFASDGGVCPTGATSCALDATGCNYCTAARCVNTIPLGCNLGGGVGDPRRLFCLCG
jgi:hypothetical protein